MDAAHYIAQARIRKAEQLAFIAWGYNFTAAEVEGFHEYQWAMLAMRAQVNNPGPVTRLMVKDRLYTLGHTKAVAA
jgi:hypothetical protein